MAADQGEAAEEGGDARTVGVEEGVSPFAVEVHLLREEALAKGGGAGTHPGKGLLEGDKRGVVMVAVGAGGVEEGVGGL